MLLILLVTGATLNVMSLMGLIMMVGIVVSNSILIVEFTNRLRAEGRPVRERVSLACRTRLRPVLMTSLATVFGLLPMALALEAGSETYAPLALSIIGGRSCPGRRIHCAKSTSQFSRSSNVWSGEAEDARTYRAGNAPCRPA